MFYQEYYSFKSSEFDKKGFHCSSGQWFMDVIGEFEHDFHVKFPDCFANHLFANHHTMALIDRAMDLEEHESSGMDMMDGEVDLDVNLALEEFSEESTVYAIGSKLEANEDEPIFLVINEKLPNDVLLLKYIDDDAEDESENPVVVSFEKRNLV